MNDMIVSHYYFKFKPNFKTNRGTHAYEDRGVITVINPKSDEDDPPKTFTFDAVFDDQVTQRHVYDICAAELIEACLAGYNGTFFAYGQTGAGKTFTMEGNAQPPEERGIIPNAFVHIFDRVNLAQAGQQFLVRVSYIEIYNEEVCTPTNCFLYPLILYLSNMIFFFNSCFLSFNG